MIFTRGGTLLTKGGQKLADMEKRLIFLFFKFYMMGKTETRKWAVEVVSSVVVQLGHSNMLQDGDLQGEGACSSRAT